MNPSQTERVVIIGASDDPLRHSHQALTLLRQHGHEVIPVHPRLAAIDGVPVVADLSAISGPVDTVTLYVGPAISLVLKDKLIALNPRRILFNPGTENAPLVNALDAVGIVCIHACTLVLLRTGQF
jgi:predicted CoA-binding protein